jgi:autotransporter-associated beta strand protein
VSNSGTAANAFAINGTLINSVFFDNFGGGQATIGASGTLNGTGSVRNRDSATLTNAGTIAIAVDNGATLNSTGALLSGLTNSGVANIAGQLLGAVSNSGTMTLTGMTTGIGAVTQTASGSFNLGGFSTSIGSLAGSGAMNLGAGTVTLGGDGSSTSFAGVISGSGGLIKTGSGRFTLAGINTYTGETRVDAGTLVLAASGQIAGAVRNSATFTNAGTVSGGVINSGDLTSAGTITGALTNNVGGTASLSGVMSGPILNSGLITLTGATTGIGAVSQTDTGSFDLAGFDTAIGNLAGSGAIALGMGTLTLGTIDAPTSFSGVISGSGGLIKTGSLGLLLDGANTYTGLTTVSEGSLVIGESGSLAGSVLNDADLVNGGTIGGLVTNSGTFLNANRILGGLTNTGTVELAGQIDGAVLNNGSITNVASAIVLGQFTQEADGSLDLAGFNSSFGSLAGGGTVALGSGFLMVGADNSSSTFGGVIAGTGGVVKVGTGTFTVTGVNTYSGETRVDAGTLVIGEADAASPMMASATGT